MSEWTFHKAQGLAEARHGYTKVWVEVRSGREGSLDHFGVAIERDVQWKYDYEEDALFERTTESASWVKVFAPKPTLS